MAERWGKVESSRAEYNGALDGARAFVEEVQDGREGGYDGTSGRRQEGEPAEAATWLAGWEQADLDGLELGGPEPVGGGGLRLRRRAVEPA